MTGISDNIVPLWVSTADQAKLKSYAYDVAAAAKLMTDAGFAKGGDGIYAKGGKALAYELYFPSDFADWTSAANHAADALNKFGIKITLRGAIRSTQLADVNNGKFQIAMMGWGIGNPHPQSSFIQDLQTFNTLQPTGGMQYPLKQGSTDFAALINAMGDGFDTEKQKPGGHRGRARVQRPPADHAPLGAVRQQPGERDQTRGTMAGGQRLDLHERRRGQLRLRHDLQRHAARDLAPRRADLRRGAPNGAPRLLNGARPGPAKPGPAHVT